MSFGKWEAFVEENKDSVEIKVFDGQLFHGDMEELFLMDVDHAHITRYVRRIVEITRSMHPVLIHFYQDDMDKAVRTMFYERRAINPVWKRGMIEWKVADSAYAQRKNYEGVTGFVHTIQKFAGAG